MSDHLQMIADIERSVREDDFNLTDWEDDFIQNLKTRDLLTPRQDEVLEGIWKRAVGA